LTDNILLYASPADMADDFLFCASPATLLSLRANMDDNILLCASSADMADDFLLCASPADR
jgi:hypothetical protein